MSKVMEGPDAADRRQHTLSEHQEVIRAIEPAVADHLSLLLPLDRAWQPTDYLPDLERVSRRDEVERFRTAAETVSDELLVVLVEPPVWYVLAHDVDEIGVSNGLSSSFEERSDRSSRNGALRR